jgi:Kef-type K+ transport system membrane component KefB
MMAELLQTSALAQVLLLLGSAVAVVLLFQRLGIPSSLAYLLIGLMLGPYTVGPVEALAEFGVVFLLFTIGLNFSLPQIARAAAPGARAGHRAGGADDLPWSSASGGWPGCR